MKGKLTVALPVHGMNSRDAGDKSIDRVARGMAVDFVDTDDTDYGWVAFLRIWIFKRRFIERVAGGIKKWIDDPRIGTIFLPVHSNGLNFTFQALKLLKKRNQLGNKRIIVIAYSGCANRKVNTDNAYHVHNWYTQEDGWLKTAKFLPSISMGSFGLSTYRGKSMNVTDKKITNHVTSHSQWFQGHTLSKTIAKTNELVRSYV